MQIKHVSRRQHFTAVTALRGEEPGLRASTPTSATQRPPGNLLLLPLLSDWMEKEEECEVVLICRLKEITQQPIPINSTQNKTIPSF